MTEPKQIKQTTKAELLDTVFDCAKLLNKLELANPNSIWVIPICNCGAGFVPFHQHKEDCPCNYLVTGKK
jgi:hypothetical protein